MDMAESTPSKPGRSICKEFTKLDGNRHTFENLKESFRQDIEEKSTLRPVADLRHHIMKDFGPCGLNSDDLLKVYARKLHDVV